MKDDEARYLIDQFNKHAGVMFRNEELDLVLVAAGIAAIGVLLGLNQVLGATRLLFDFSTRMTILTIAIGALIFALIYFIQVIRRKYEDFQKRLLLLEDYRSQYKSLPDTVTLNIIEAEKRELLENLLKEAERSVIQSGHL